MKRDQILIRIKSAPQSLWQNLPLPPTLIYAENKSPHPSIYFWIIAKISCFEKPKEERFVYN